MLFYPNMPYERRRFLHALVFPALISLWLVLIYVLQYGLQWNVEAWGVEPRTVAGLRGVLLHPFAHAGLSHLFNNVSTFFILSVALYYFYRDVANKVLLLLWPMTGILLWLIGRDSIHIGASGVIYGLAFFIFWGGLLMHNISLLAISLAVVFWYGSMVWDMLPFLPNESISWEGHLSGAIAGSILAFVFRKSGWHPAETESEESSEDDELSEIAMKYDKEGEAPREELEPEENREMK
jgi:membrane associated rhomboid family serine protease